MRERQLAVRKRARGGGARRNAGPQGKGSEPQRSATEAGASPVFAVSRRARLGTSKIKINHRIHIAVFETV